MSYFSRHIVSVQFCLRREELKARKLTVMIHVPVFTTRNKRRNHFLVYFQLSLAAKLSLLQFFFNYLTFKHWNFNYTYLYRAWRTSSLKFCILSGQILEQTWNTIGIGKRFTVDIFLLIFADFKIKFKWKWLKYLAIFLRCCYFSLYYRFFIKMSTSFLVHIGQKDKVHLPKFQGS